ncbi:hypothetical protein Celaphus_00012783, partial [Cervus elaphus hippelaphus]
VIVESQGHQEKKEIEEIGGILELIVSSKALREKREGVDTRVYVENRGPRGRQGPPGGFGEKGFVGA